jgi:hypothetical protein
MSAAQHTPGPWAIDPNTGEICAPTARGYVTVCDPTMGHSLATMRSLPVDEKQANAERIIQCVNAHDELLEVARGFEALMRCPSSPQRSQALAAQADRARSAIAKATGGGHVCDGSAAGTLGCPACKATGEQP